MTTFLMHQVQVTESTGRYQELRTSPTATFFSFCFAVPAFRTFPLTAFRNMEVINRKDPISNPEPAAFFSPAKAFINPADHPLAFTWICF